MGCWLSNLTLMSLGIFKKPRQFPRGLAVALGAMTVKTGTYPAFLGDVAQ